MFAILALLVVCFLPLSGTSEPTHGNTGGGDDWDADNDGYVDLALGGGGFTMIGGIGATDFAGEEGGGTCLTNDGTNAAGVDCNSGTLGQRISHPIGPNGATINRCLVAQVSAVAGWSAGDVIALQIISVTLPGLVEADVGDPFYIQHTADTCAAAPASGAANCIVAGTSGEWDVSGTTAVASGYLGIEIDAASNDNEDDADIRLSVVCTYVSR